MNKILKLLKLFPRFSSENQEHIRNKKTNKQNVTINHFFGTACPGP